ncbi:MAG TPA: 2-hydroxyacid dehydrogenase [Spirochaetia bacterium]|nr:2-hydroxyacid dehydrogenase [Spirochaetia bacterium]HRZ65710.1 2-hydroxyacid dehydrogenase [Spirochaetia bacterium]
MEKIALVGPYGSDVRSMLEKRLGGAMELVSIPDAGGFGRLADIEYVILRVLPMNRATIESMPRLKLIQRWGVGFDKVDIAAAGERGIPVAIAPGANAAPVSELALLLMLATYRNLVGLHNGIVQGRWEKEKFIDNSFMIKGKTVGLIGCGAIGSLVAKKAQAFGAEVVYFDARRLPEETERELGLKYLGLDEVLSTADIISLHLPLLDSTRGMIGAREIGLMKPTAILVNTARGEIMDSGALAAALREKRIAGAGLDVFDSEPLSPESPLRSLDNVVMTPHVGGNTADMSVEMVDICLQNILTVRDKKELPAKVLVNGQFLK